MSIAILNVKVKILASSRYENRFEGAIGVVENTLDTIANEVLVLDNNIMIPYVDAFIKSINEKEKKIEVFDVKGLIS